MSYYDVYSLKDLLSVDFDLFRHTSALNAPNSKKQSWIYFLESKNKEIVYIGQSFYNPVFRVFNHSLENEKEFSFFRSVLIKNELDQEFLNIVEAEMILKYQPIYNKLIPRNRKFATLERCLFYAKKTKWDFKKALKRTESSFKTKEFKRKKYYLINEILNIFK